MKMILLGQEVSYCKRCPVCNSRGYSRPIVVTDSYTHKPIFIGQRCSCGFERRINLKKSKI